MVATDRVRDLFEDARGLRLRAMEQFAQGDVRDAAEKAWCATRRATDGLVLAHTGDEPERSSESSSSLRLLESLHPEVRRARLVRRYYTRQGHQHGDCFYAGLCEPIDDTERRIHETAGYIDDAERLASA